MSRVEQILKKYVKEETTVEEESIILRWLHHLNEDKEIELQENDFEKAHKIMWQAILSKTVFPR